MLLRNRVINGAFAQFCGEYVNYTSCLIYGLSIPEQDLSAKLAFLRALDNYEIGEHKDLVTSKKTGQNAETLLNVGCAPTHFKSAIL